jgi:hypothetical protein
MARGQRTAGTPPHRVLGERWEGRMQALFLGVRAWRASQPTATQAEMERELERQMARVRAQILRTWPGAPRPTCGAGRRRPVRSAGACCTTRGGRPARWSLLGDEAMSGARLCDPRPVWAQAIPHHQRPQLSDEGPLAPAPGARPRAHWATDRDLTEEVPEQRQDRHRGGSAITGVTGSYSHRP